MFWALSYFFKGIYILAGDILRALTSKWGCSHGVANNYESFTSHCVIRKSKFMLSKFEKHEIVCMEIGMVWEAFPDPGLSTVDHQSESSCSPMCSCERLHWTLPGCHTPYSHWRQWIIRHFPWQMAMKCFWGSSTFCQIVESLWIW